MIDEQALITAIYEQQREDKKACELLCLIGEEYELLYNSRKSVRDKIIETIGNMARGEKYNV